MFDAAQQGLADRRAGGRSPPAAEAQAVRRVMLRGFGAAGATNFDAVDFGAAATHVSAVEADARTDYVGP